MIGSFFGLQTLPMNIVIVNDDSLIDAGVKHCHLWFAFFKRHNFLGIGLFVTMVFAPFSLQVVIA